MMLEERWRTYGSRRLRNRRKYLPYTLAFVAGILGLTVFLSAVTGKLGTGTVSTSVPQSWSRNLNGQQSDGVVDTSTSESSFSVLEASNIGEEQTCDNNFDQNGGIAVYIIGILYLFLGLAIICDEHFVASLEVISDKLDLSEDVAGATFMAAGSSAPELFTSLMGTLFATASVGVGTIIGSAVFNILVIIGLTAALSGSVLQLDWRPLARDCTFYAISIGTMIAVFNNREVDWWESLILLAGYVIYIVFMTQNAKIMVSICGAKPKEANDKDDKDAGAKLPPNSSSKSLSSYGSSSSLQSSSSGASNEDESDEDSGSSSAGSSAESYDSYRSESRSDSWDSRDSRDSSYDESGRRGKNSLDVPEGERKRRTSMVIVISDGHPHIRDRDEDQFGHKDGEDKSDEEPSGFLGKILHVLSIPYIYAFKYTIPDCREKRWSEGYWYMVTFINSILWITALSYGMVEFGTKIGCITTIPDAIMGMTLLAAGTSVPDAMSSVLVGRQGQGDMAIANSIGSNVFDIFLGLGFPWFLATCIIRPGDPIPVDADRLFTFAVILFVILVLTILMLLADRWRLRPVTGFLMFALYALFLVYALLSGLDVIDF